MSDSWGEMGASVPNDGNPASTQSQAGNPPRGKADPDPRAKPGRNGFRWSIGLAVNAICVGGILAVLGLIHVLPWHALVPPSTIVVVVLVGCIASWGSEKAGRSDKGNGRKGKVD